MEFSKHPFKKKKKKLHSLLLWLIHCNWLTPWLQFKIINIVLCEDFLQSWIKRAITQFDTQVDKFK